METESKLVCVLINEAGNSAKLTLKDIFPRYCLCICVEKYLDGHKRDSRFFHVFKFILSVFHMMNLYSIHFLSLCISALCPCSTPPPNKISGNKEKKGGGELIMEAVM